MGCLKLTTKNVPRKFMTLVCFQHIRKFYSLFCLFVSQKPIKHRFGTTFRVLSVSSQIAFPEMSLFKVHFSSEKKINAHYVGAILAPFFFLNRRPILWEFSRDTLKFLLICIPFSNDTGFSAFLLSSQVGGVCCNKLSPNVGLWLLRRN